MPWHLLCVGELGVGKTVLSSIFGHRLTQDAQEPSLPVLSIFLDYNASKTQAIERLVGSLLQQLIQLDESFVIPSELKTLHKKAKRLGYEPASYYIEIRKLLVSVLDKFEQAFVIVDAFDELVPNERSALLQELPNLKPGDISLLLTSRGISEETGKGTYQCDRCCQRKLKLVYHCQICASGNFDLCYECKKNGLWCDDRSHKLKEPYGQVEIAIKVPASYIENYVRHEIGAQIELEGVEIDKRDTTVHENPMTTPFQDLVHRDPDLPAQIITKITENAAGRFLYARLYLDSLKIRTNLLTLMSVLEEPFPQDMDGIFEDGMERIQLQDMESRKQGLRILGILTYARRPLLLEELKHALAVLTMVETPGVKQIRKEKIHRGIDETKSILGSNSSLVIVEEEHVRLVHRSLEEYLFKVENSKKLLPDAEYDLARACMIYLDLALLLQPSEEDIIVSTNAEFPLLQYASQYWGDHVREVSRDPEHLEYMRDKVFRLMNNSERMCSCIQAALVTSAGGHNTWDVRRNLDKLHICAWFGLSNIISEMNPEPGMVDKLEPKYGQTPLMYACRKGHDEVVEQLLQLGASQRKTSAQGRTALFEAILSHRQRKCSTATVSETLCKHGAVVRLSVRDMPGDLDINMGYNQKYDRTALMLATILGQLEIVNILLGRKGIDVDLQDANGMTALLHAAREGHCEIVKRLIDAQASMEIVDYQVGRSPLRCAAERNNEEIVELLLNCGADPNLRDREGGTAVLRAVSRGAEDVVKAMMDIHFVDFNCVDEEGQGLLHGAARNGYPKIARLLLDHGLQPDAHDKHGRTPLSEASRYGYLPVASALLEHGANASLTDHSNRLPSTIAWQYGKQDILRILPPIFQDEDLPIWALARQGLADLLSEAIRSRPHNLLTLEPCTDNTPLHCAIEATDVDVLSLLLETPSPAINQANHWGRTPLHLAALYGDTSAITLLLSQKSPNVDLNSLDRWNDPPIVLAQSNFHLETLLQLVKAGARIPPKHRIDVTALFFFAVEQGDVDAVNVLIGRWGVDRSVQNKEGKRAIAIAKAGDDVEMIRALNIAKTVNLMGMELGDEGEGEREEEKVVIGRLPFRARALDG